MKRHLRALVLFSLCVCVWFSLHFAGLCKRWSWFCLRAQPSILSCGPCHGSGWLPRTASAMWQAACFMRISSVQRVRNQAGRRFPAVPPSETGGLGIQWNPKWIGFLQVSWFEFRISRGRYHRRNNERHPDAPGFGRGMIVRCSRVDWSGSCIQSLPFVLTVLKPVWTLLF